MIPYRNANHLSSVCAYECGDTWIRVEFYSGAIRDYTYENVGREHVEAMKKCAKKGKGLGSYVIRNEPYFIALKKIRDAQKNA
jgi:hypothetical protein